MELNENMTYEEYIKQMVEQGYIDENGTPLKCWCGSEDLENINQSYENLGIVEYDVKCKKCNKIVGSWCYGHWDI